MYSDCAASFARHFDLRRQRMEGVDVLVNFCSLSHCADCAAYTTTALILKSLGGIK